MGPRGPMGEPPRMMGGRPPGLPPRHHRRKENGHMPFPDKMEEADFYEENFDMSQMEKECEEMLNIHYLTKDNCIFSPSDGGFINLKFMDNTYENVTIIRTFPFTEPNRYLSVRENSGKKKEIGMINSLEEDFDIKTVSIIKK